MNTSAQIRPINDIVLIRRVTPHEMEMGDFPCFHKEDSPAAKFHAEVEAMTSSGIVLCNPAMRKRCRGTVIALGPKCSGKLHVGDTVIFCDTRIYSTQRSCEELPDDLVMTQESDLLSQVITVPIPPEALVQ